MMEHSLTYPYNWLLLTGFIILVIWAIVSYVRRANRKDDSEK